MARSTLLTTAWGAAAGALVLRRGAGVARRSFL